MSKRIIEAFNIAAGPTGTGVEPPAPIPIPVGGELLLAEIFPVLPKYAILILILLLPVIFIFGKKRSTILEFLSKYW